MTSIIFSEKKTGKFLFCGNVKNCYSVFSDLELYIDMGYFNIKYLLILFVGSPDSKLCDVFFSWHSKGLNFELNKKV